MAFYKFLSSTRFSRYIKLVFLIGDLLILVAAFVCSTFLRTEQLTMMWNKEDKAIFILFIITWLALVAYTHAYKMFRVEKIYMTIAKTIKVVFFHLGIISLLLVVFNYDDVSRLRMMYFYMIFLVLLIAFRASLLKALKHARKEGYNFKQVIIIGANEMGENMNTILQHDLSYGYQVMGAFCNNPDNNITHTLKLLGQHKDIENYLLNNDVDEMYIALEYQHTHIIPELMELCERNMIRMKIIPNFQQYTKSRKVNIDFYENIPVMMLRKEPQELVTNRIIKKLFDLAFSFLVIIFIVSWLFLIFLLLVKLSSNGPVFFMH